MVTMLRHFLSIMLLPFLVVVVIPYTFLNGFAVEDTRWEDGLFAVSMLRLAGIVVIGLGFLLFSWCVSLFASVGQGTLAPWDATRNFVARGPYRVVRNPMISGVAFMLIGQTLYWGSWLLATWTGAFILINHIYFVLSEEPGLEGQFGEAYRAYKASVPRWIPRIRPRSH